VIVRKNIVSASAFAVCALLLATAVAGPKASGPLKAYKGPEGEIVIMVEVNDGKEIVVQFKKTGGELEGKTKLYLYEDVGHGDKNVFYNTKRGSKTYRSVVLTARDNDWTLYVPGKNQDLHLSYSEQLSQDTKAEDVLAAYKP
jgi:hypothetical protein